MTHPTMTVDAGRRPPLPVRLAAVTGGALLIWLAMVWLAEHAFHGLPDAGQHAANAVVVCAASLALVVAARRHLDRRPFSGLRLPGPATGWRPMLVWAAAYLVPATAGVAASMAAGWVQLTVTAPATRLLGAVVLVTVLVFAFEALPEELIFRGYVYRNLSAALPAWQAVIGQAVLFAGVATTLWVVTEGWGVLPERAVAFLGMGLGMGCLRVFTGGVWACIGLHWAFQVIAQLLASQRYVEIEIQREQTLQLVLVGAAVAGIHVTVRAVRSRPNFAPRVWRAPEPDPGPGPVRTAPPAAAPLRSVRHGPVTPSASAPVRAVLDLLYDQTGRAVISGQHNQPVHGSAWTLRMAELAGRTPALWGQEIGFSAPGTLDGINFRVPNLAHATGWHRRGGVVAYTWHAVCPVDDEPVRFRAGLWRRAGIVRRISPDTFDAVLEPGSALHARWCAQVDVAAGLLGRLAAAGVPVLWRPYHEMNAGWFWWGGDPQRFVALWRQLYDRLVHHHGLPNLVWVWSPHAAYGTAVPFAPYFPGHDVVDALAVDTYGGHYEPRHYEAVCEIAEGRPVGLGEVGALPTPAVLDDQPGWCWFMGWPEVTLAQTGRAAIRARYADPRVLTLDTLPAWR